MFYGRVSHWLDHRFCWLLSLGVLKTGFRQSWLQGLEDIFTLFRSQLCIFLDWHYSQAGCPHMGTQIISAALNFHPASFVTVAERYWLQKYWWLVLDQQWFEGSGSWSHPSTEPWSGRVLWSMCPSLEAWGIGGQGSGLALVQPPEWNRIAWPGEEGQLAPQSSAGSSEWGIPAEGLSSGTEVLCCSNKQWSAVVINPERHPWHIV